MRRPRIHRWGCRAGALLVLAVALPAVVPAPAPAGADGCPDVEVIFARGTEDSPGLGRIGDAFVADLRGRIGSRSLDTYAVAYPATYNFLEAAVGANDASARVQDMVNRCPATRLVLGGYSQGAAVIDIVGAVPVPALGFDNPLPPEADDHVAAIAVFGNPTAKLRLPLTVSPIWGAKSIDLCVAGDPVCQLDGQNFAVHRDYAGSQAAQAADFVAGRL